jgi:hypothetical protein
LIGDTIPRMNGEDIGKKLDSIFRTYLQLHLSLLDQRAEINTVAAMLLQIAPFLTEPFQSQLKIEKAKIAEEYGKLARKLEKLPPPEPDMTSQRPN